MANSTEIWVVTKNGNFGAAYGTKERAISGMREVAKAPKAEEKVQKDGSIRLADVPHFRASKVPVS